MMSKRVRTCLFVSIVGILSLFWEIPTFAANQTQSGATATTIIGRARNYLAETSADYWTDAELLNHVNDGVVFIASVSYCTQTTESVTLSAGVSQYTLNNEYFDIESVVYNGGSTIYNKGLIGGNIQSIGNVPDVEEPTYWAEFAGQVIIYPVPDSSVSGYTITVYEYLKPTLCTSGASVVALPSIYDYPLVLYVASRAMEKVNGGLQRAASLLEQCVSLLGIYGTNINKRQKEEEAVVK